MSSEKVAKELRKKYKEQLEINNYHIKSLKGRICVCADNGFSVYLRDQEELKDWYFECWNCIRYMQMNDF